VRLALSLFLPEYGILKHLPLDSSLVLICLLVSEELLSAPPSVHHPLGILLLGARLLILRSTAANHGMKRALFVDLYFLLEVRPVHRLSLLRNDLVLFVEALVES
jgi:hypothetical protein